MGMGSGEKECRSGPDCVHFSPVLGSGICGVLTVSFSPGGDKFYHLHTNFYICNVYYSTKAGSIRRGMALFKNIQEQTWRR